MAYRDHELLPGIHHIEDCMGVCFTLIVGERRALLVDAGYGLWDAAAFVRGITDLPVTLWLTHGHFDHAPGARWFEDVRVHPDELSCYAEYTGERWRRHVLDCAAAEGIAADEADYLSARMPEPTPVPGEAIDLGGLTAEVISCPGHTPGSVVVRVPERSLLLTGDDWNPCAWLFFHEALPVRQYRASMRALLDLEFEHVICSHRTGLYPRRSLEAFLDGLTDAAIDAARPVDTGAQYGAATREAGLPGGQVLVFDGEKAR